MTLPGNCKRILFVSLKKEAEPLLAQLRAAGHQVSVVQDMDDAQALLASGGFDQTIFPSQTIEPLLAERAVWESAGGVSWRRSTAAIAHDIRTLLDALERCTRDLEGEQLARPPDEVIQLRRTILTLSTFLQELTDDFDSEPGRGLVLKTMDLEDAVETAAIAVYSSATERRQRLVIDIEERARYIRADPIRIKRVISNLLLHASRQMPSLGTVTVRARRESQDCVISVCFTAETVSISGLTALFRPKDGRVERVSGGFHGVQSIVEQHGGRLWVESERGAGTSIFVSLPSPETSSSEAALSLAPG